MFFNCTLGLGIIAARFYSWFCLGILTIGRADLCNLPSPSMIQLLDLPWNTYVALVMQDHQYNSPVVSVFYQLLSHSLSRSRRSRALRKVRVNVKLVVEALWVLRHEDQERAIQESNPSLVHTLLNGLRGSALELTQGRAQQHPNGTARAEPRISEGDEEQEQDLEEATGLSAATEGGAPRLPTQRPTRKGVKSKRGAKSIVAVVGNVVKSSRESHPPPREARQERSAPDTTPASIPEDDKPPIPHARRNALVNTVEVVKQQVDELLLASQPRHRLLLVSTVHNQEMRIMREQTRRRALNRWALALMLLLNPSLRRYRRWGPTPSKSSAEEGSHGGENGKSATSRRKRASLAATSRRIQSIHTNLKVEEQADSRGHRMAPGLSV